MLTLAPPSVTAACRGRMLAVLLTGRGLAPDATVLVLARIAQAMGAALLTPQIFSLVHLHWDGAARGTRGAPCRCCCSPEPATPPCGWRC
ncbi:hypothetical protein E1267_00730 [Nonomuraea longispora]|uniref:MFS transporter n=1 Tax=Nonomuraea longispora TaxID=1848320 RepID=A0A4R4NQA9_9ACTN|nr:hypothetical protein [Nonomuraea longispora]TDC11495.1 hypothetical protein E1267_00730 [Nonomuraea longispora]